MKMPTWETAFFVVAKVPGVGNKVIVSTLTAIRGESWCKSAYADLCVFPPVCNFLCVHVSPETWIS